MIDILYLAKDRPEFTAESLYRLVKSVSTNSHRLIIYNDGCPLVRFPDNSIIDRFEYGGPVAIMNAYLARPDRAHIFAKIDNDVIVPDGWLTKALSVMDLHPELDLLGLEPPLSRTPNPKSAFGWKPEELHAVCGPGDRVAHGYCYARTKAVGGVGLFRSSAFDGRPMTPHGFNGVGGFTDWQLAHPEVRKGWITPPIDLFLLDRLPIEPWESLSKRYIAEGIQRPWTNYSMETAEQIAGWWL